MRADEIRAEYAVLENAVQQVNTFIETADQVYLDLLDRYTSLEGEWVGFGWSSFSSEMENDLIPALYRLVQALVMAEDKLSKTRRELEETELRGALTIKGNDITWEEMVLELPGFGNVLGFFDALNLEDLSDGQFANLLPELRKLMQSLSTGFGSSDDFIRMMGNFGRFLTMAGKQGLVDVVKDYKALGKFFGEIGDMAQTGNLKVPDDLLKNTGTILGILGAVTEGVSEYGEDSGDGLVEHISAEAIEFGLESVFRAAMYSNPITGTMMATYDIVQFAASIEDDVAQWLGVDIDILPDPESFDYVDDISDWAGDTIAEAGDIVTDWVGNWWND